MITRKQYPNHHVYEMEIGGRPFTVETGKVAELANAECICRYGDTVVLVTCTCNPIPKAGIDYFPLTIEFRPLPYVKWWWKQSVPAGRESACSRWENNWQVP